MSGLVYLASYPKSGNTWFRTFLSFLLKEKDEEITINHLKTHGIFSSRSIVDEISGMKTSNMTFSEIDELRHSSFEYLAEKTRIMSIIKIHDAYTFLPDGTALVPGNQSKAIYILRNPLDVAVSFAHHSNKEIDRTIEDMANERFAMCGAKKRLLKQFRQQLLSWSGHVESWTTAANMPIHVVRYEDMLKSPVETFKAALVFLGLDFSDEEIECAVKLASFDRLKEQEKKIGFREKPTQAKSFFREGKAGGWRNRLTEEQVDKLIRDHAKVMRRWGYLDDAGTPVI
ncbi:MAG: sulfotransferase domain-containing protein [Clostridiaceae bacterium]|nr:sulfotransferase domain-containing protein [Clostridiaceae bacterium]